MFEKQVKRHYGVGFAYFVFIWIGLGFLALLGIFLSLLSGAKSAEDPMAALGAISIVIFSVVLFSLPSVIASVTVHPSRTGIHVLNWLLGWTGIGWLIAMLWALAGANSRLSCLEPLSLAAPEQTRTIAQLITFSLGAALIAICALFIFSRLHPIAGDSQQRRTSAPPFTQSPTVSAPTAQPRVADKQKTEYWFTTDNGSLTDGEFALSDSGVEVAGETFPPVSIRSFSPEEVRNAATQMSVQIDPRSTGTLVKVHIPSAEKLANGMPLCNADIDWMVVLTAPKPDGAPVKSGEHRVALGFFASDSEPDFSVPSSTSFCPGTWHRSNPDPGSVAAPEPEIPLPELHNSADTYCKDNTQCTDQEFLSVIEGMKRQWAQTPNWVRSRCVNDHTFPRLQDCILHTTVSWLNQNPSAKAPWITLENSNADKEQ